MGKLVTVKKDDHYIFQVDRDMSENTIEGGEFKAKTYAMNTLQGVANLTASFMTKTDLKRLEFDSTGTVKYKMHMRNGSSMEMGVRCSASWREEKGKVVVPMMLQCKNGFTVGIEVKATLDSKNYVGTIIFVEIPFGGGRLVINWNPTRRKLTIQLRKAQKIPDRQSGYDAYDGTDMYFGHLIELNPMQGLLLVYNRLLFTPTESEYLSPVHRMENAVVQKKTQFNKIMDRLFTVKEDDIFIFQVDSDLKYNSIKAGVFVTKTYTKKDLFGVKNLSASFMTKVDLEKLKFDSTGTVKYTVEMGNGSSVEMGVQYNFSKREVVVPMMLHTKNGFKVGIEVKATMDARKLAENGVNLVVGIPFLEGQLIMKWNPVSAKFTVQLRKNKPEKGGRYDDDDDDDDEDSVCHVLELDPMRGFILVENGLLLRENEYLSRVQRIEIENKVAQTESNNWGFFSFIGDLVGAVFTTNNNSNDSNKYENTNYVYN